MPSVVQTLSLKSCLAAFFLGLFGCACIASFSGCSTQTTRKRWLQQQLVEDNFLLFRRSPDATAGKFLKMSSTLYNYFRGTVRIYLEDMAIHQHTWMPTTLGTPESSAIPSVIDPHPENIGTYKNSKGEILADFNDFDAATYAPYYFDVRRLTVGFAVHAHQVQMPQRSAAHYTDLLQQVSRGYWEEIQRQKAGKQLHIRYAKGFGTLLDDLLKRAQKHGKEKRKQNEITRVQDGKRRFFIGTLESSTLPHVVRNQQHPVTKSEHVMLRRLLHSYAHTRFQKIASSWLHFKGAIRRLGAGVGSYPRLRYYVLVEGPTKAHEDDWILEFKEMTDQPVLPSAQIYPKQSFQNNGQRSVRMQRMLQEGPENDIHLGWASVDPMIFRVRHRTAFQKNYSTERFIEKYKAGKWSYQDLIQLAHQAGRLLARAHAQTQTRTGHPSVDVIHSALGKQSDVWVRETEQFARHYTSIVVQDFQLFQSLLKEKGKWLGYFFLPPVSP